MRCYSKRFRKCWLIAICLIAYHCCLSQSIGNKFDINPSKVFEIRELYDQNLNDSKLLYRNGVFQNIQYVDRSSIIYINVLQDSLAKKLEFVGNISISATLNDREIAVQGYSAVGEESITIGVDGINSTRDFAATLIGLVSEASKFSTEVFNPARQELLSYLERVDSEENTKKTEVEIDVLNRYERDLQSILEFSESDTSKVISIENVVKNYNSNLFSFLTGNGFLSDIETASPKNLGLRKLQSLITDLRNSIAKSKIVSDRPRLKFQDIRYQFQRVSIRLPLLVQYIEYLSKSNKETAQAFSKAIERDPIFVQFISEKLTEAYLDFGRAFSDFEVAYSSPNPHIDSLKSSMGTFSNNFDRISYFLGQILPLRDEIVKSDLMDYDQDLSDNELNKINGLKENLNFEPNGIYSKIGDEIFQTYYSNKVIKNSLIDDLTISAGRYIYKKLIPGIIDLKYEGASEGDELRVYVEWFNHEGSETVDLLKSESNENYSELQSSSPRTYLGEDTNELKPLSYLIGSFTIKEVGWKRRVSDSFFLVNQLRAPKDLMDSSPSKYKGAPGVSLLWGYGDDGSSNFLSTIEPSLGVNVSYLDFSTSRDIEIGAGLVLGLFRNRLFFTYGTNLNIPDSKAYFGIGFSFANLAGIFSDDKRD